MALFLPIILAFSSFADLANTPSQRHIAAWVGPTVSAAEPDYSLTGIAMLQATPSFHLSDTPVSKSKVGEGIMETALFTGSEFMGDGHPAAKQASGLSGAEGPDLGDYFAMPAKGFNWGKLHPHNAVDIASDCGTEIRASAEGMVNETSLGLWNGGYGHYILISHPNGTKTRYAHLNKVLVSVGQRVKKGELIGTMGETGNATGCHVHFEVIGAVNPFASR